MALLSRLEQNCHALYHVQSSSQRTLPLVANYAGTHIYDSRYFWGRLWICFYSIAQWFNPNLRFDKLQQAVIHTNLLFHKTTAAALVSLDHYHSYLEKAAEGLPLDEASYMPHRRQLKAWLAATLPFQKTLENTADLRLKSLFSACFNTDNQIFTSPHLPALRRMHSVLQLEGHLQGPMPLTAFKKILEGKPLNILESKRCAKWLNKLNKSALQPRQLQKAIQTLAARLAASLPQEMAVSKLLSYLERKGCQLLYKPCRKHLRWVNTLACGVAIDKSNGLVIEREISPLLEGRGTRVFSLINNQASIAIVAQNQARLYLRTNEDSTKMPPEIDIATLIGIYENGKYALVEKLHSLENYAWNSPEGDSKTKEPLLIKLCQLVKYFLTANYSLRGFSTRTLLMDNFSHLKLTQPLATRELDFNALEEFISKISAHHPDTYMRLMKDSGMSEHLVAKFYQDIVHYQLRDDSIAVDNLAGIYKIVDPQVVDRGAALVKEIQQIQSKLYQQLQSLYPQKPFKQLHNELNTAILNTYSRSGYVNKLPPHLFEQVIALFPQKHS